MQIISSYGVELRKQNIPVRQTLEIYRSAVSYLIGIYLHPGFLLIFPIPAHKSQSDS